MIVLNSIMIILLNFKTIQTKASRKRTEGEETLNIIFYVNEK